MQMLTKETAETWLAEQGVRQDEIVKVMSGFDLTRPLYLNQFWPGDRLFKMIRLPSALDPVPTTGQWFGLAGMTTAGVAINDGLSGRRLAEFSVSSSFQGLEGTAAPFNGSIHSGIGGPGGQTQVFIPYLVQMTRLSSVGPAAPW